MAPKATWRARLAALLAAVLLFGSGCWDRKEIEDMGFVMAIGLDSGTGGRMAVTFQVANPRAMAAGAGAGSGATAPAAPPLLVERIEETAVHEAIRNLETKTNRRISLVQLRLVVIGKELAQSGLSAVMDALARSREMRQTMMVMMAEGTAEEILRLNPVLERDPSLFLEDLTRRAHERTAWAPQVHLHEFLEAYETLGKEPVLPIVHPDRTTPALNDVRRDTKPMLQGTAVFHGDRVTCELDTAETEMLLMLQGRSNSFVESVPLPDEAGRLISLELSSQGVRIAVDPSGREPRFTVTVTLEAQIRETERLPERWTTPDAMNRIGLLIGRQVEKKANRLMKRLQEKCQADALGLGERLQVRFLDYAAWERFDWPARFPHAALEAKVTTIVRRNGMTRQTPMAR